MAALVVTAAVVVVAAILVIAKVVVVVAREVLVVGEVVETGLRVGKPVTGGGSAACGASAGEHAAAKTANTAKAKAKCFTANSFPENTHTTIGFVERMRLMCVPSLFKLIIVCPMTAFLKAGVGGCWGDIAHVQAFVV